MLPGDDATHTIQFSLVTPVATATSSLVLVFMSPLGVLILLPRRFASFRCILVMRMFLVAALLLMIPGCGSSSTPQVPLGTSTVVMTGTAVGGSAHHSANIVVTITQ